MIRALACVSLLTLAPRACADIAPPLDSKRSSSRPKGTLGAPRYTRSSALITQFSWTNLLPHARARSVGGSDDEGALRIEGCGDDPQGAPTAAIGRPVADEHTGLVLTIVKATPAGKSGRGWLGNQCRFRIADPNAADRYVELDAPPFHTVTSLEVKDGDVFVALHFSGYAKEIGGKGNYVAVGDLATHQLKWRTKDLSSNAAMLLVEDYLVVGYGFTKEPASLTVLDRRTGAVLQRLALPKAPDGMRLGDGQLYVRLYDGYATIPWEPERR